jgi:hypothetical protein
MDGWMDVIVRPRDRWQILKPNEDAMAMRGQDRTGGRTGQRRNRESLQYFEAQKERGDVPTTNHCQIKGKRYLVYLFVPD